MRFIFDFFIVLFLITSMYGIVFLSRVLRQNKKTKLKPLFASLLLIFLLFFAVIFYGSFIEPKMLKVTTVNINLGATTQTENIKIAFVSDIHVGAYKKSAFVEKIVARITEMKPDLILLGGDYLLGQEKYSTELSPLSALPKLAPTFAVTGNHEFERHEIDSKKTLEDKTATLRKMFADYGIEILDNANDEIIIRGEKINIVGLEDLWTSQANLQQAAGGIDLENPSILLSHNPDIVLESSSQDFDLIISGHTHGGQIRLPIIGAVPPIPDKLGRDYDRGLFKIKNSLLFISSGAGETGPRARLFCPPEVVVLTVDL